MTMMTNERTTMMEMIWHLECMLANCTSILIMTYFIELMTNLRNSTACLIIGCNVSLAMTTDWLRNIQHSESRYHNNKPQFTYDNGDDDERTYNNVGDVLTPCDEEHDKGAHYNKKTQFMYVEVCTCIVSLQVTPSYDK